MILYAVPRFLSGTSLGTDGHNAAGTSEKAMPIIIIKDKAYIGLCTIG